MYHHQPEVTAIVMMVLSAKNSEAAKKRTQKNKWFLDGRNRGQTHSCRSQARTRWRIGGKEIRAPKDIASKQNGATHICTERLHQQLFLSRNT